MRRKDRELNIFSMSALDLFASGMGAFILITIILLLRDTADQPPPEPPVCPPPTPAQTCPVCPICQTCPELPVPQECPTARIVDNLIVIQMRWTTIGSDIDLYIESPDGRYKWNNPYIPGRPGELTLDNRGDPSDMRNGQGLEIWQSYKPTPGKYMVCYGNVGGSSRRVGITGKLDKPTGPVPFPRMNLLTGQRVAVFAFEITPDYEFMQIEISDVRRSCAG